MEDGESEPLGVAVPDVLRVASWLGVLLMLAVVVALGVADVDSLGVPETLDVPVLLCVSDGVGVEDREPVMEGD